MNPEELRKEFKKQTGEEWTRTGTDGVHNVLITVPNKKYVEWLEEPIEYGDHP